MRESLSLSEAPTVVDVGANEGDYSLAVLEANKNARGLHLSRILKPTNDFHRACRWLSISL